MSTLTLALAQVAPYYNLGLVVVAMYLFITLFRIKGKGVYMLPWKLLFAGVVIFIIEELITILRAARFIDIPAHINGFFELAIIFLFIYMLLLQKAKMKK